MQRLGFLLFNLVHDVVKTICRAALDVMEHSGNLIHRFLQHHVGLCLHVSRAEEAIDLVPVGLVFFQLAPVGIFVGQLLAMGGIKSLVRRFRHSYCISRGLRCFLGRLGGISIHTTHETVGAFVVVGLCLLNFVQELHSFRMIVCDCVDEISIHVSQHVLALVVDHRKGVLQDGAFVSKSLIVLTDVSLEGSSRVIIDFQLFQECFQANTRLLWKRLAIFRFS